MTIMGLAALAIVSTVALSHDATPTLDPPAVQSAPFASFTPNAHDAAATIQVPGTIPPNCSTEVTATFNSWLTTVPDASTITFPAGACYWIDGTIQVQDRHDLTFQGTGTLFKAKTTYPATPKRGAAMFSILGGSGISFTGIALQGTHTLPGFVQQREWYPGLEYRGVDGGLVDNVTGRNLWGDFVSFTPDTRPEVDSYPKNIVVQNSSTSNIGRSQVMCNGCEDILITKNVFTDTGYQVFNIEVEAAWWHADNVAYIDNVIAGRVPLNVFVNAGIGDYVTNITFSDNTMSQDPVSCQPPISVLDTNPRKSDFTFTGNSLRTLSWVADLAGVQRVTMEDNTATLTWGGMCGMTDPGTAVRLRASVTGQVHGNTFFDFKRITNGAPPPAAICGNRINGEDYNKPVSCP